MKPRNTSRSLLSIVIIGLLLNITLIAQDPNLSYSNYIRNPDFTTITGCAAGANSCQITNVGTAVYNSGSGSAPWFFTTAALAPSSPNIKFDLVTNVNTLTGAATNAYGAFLIDDQDAPPGTSSVCSSQVIKYFPKGQWYVRSILFVKETTGNPQQGEGLSIKIHNSARNKVIYSYTNSFIAGNFVLRETSPFKTTISEKDVIF
jgi:hypothetical protein